MYSVQWKYECGYYLQCSTLSYALGGGSIRAAGGRGDDEIEAGGSSLWSIGGIEWELLMFYWMISSTPEVRAIGILSALVIVFLLVAADRIWR